MKKIYILLFFATLTGKTLSAQSQIEWMGGHKGLSIDGWWVENLDVKKHFLTFNRGRAYTSYDQTVQNFLVQSTMAYSLKNGLGFLVLGNYNNSGFRVKSGVQFYKKLQKFTLLSWVVADLHKQPGVGMLALVRYDDVLKFPWRWFSQLELAQSMKFNDLHTAGTQRIRIGVSVKGWRFGPAIDFNHTDFKEIPKATINVGVAVQKAFN